MRMLEEAPSHPRHNEENEAAADAQALPAEPERRPQDDGESGQYVQPVGSSGRAPEYRGLTNLRKRPKKSPGAWEERVEPDERTRFEGSQSGHCAGATAATDGARRPTV